MADEQRENEPGDPGPAPTPFDHPLFLPVVLSALTVWFGVDVVFQREAFQKYPAFNIGGLALLLPASVYFWIKGLRELRGSRPPKRDGS